MPTAISDSLQLAEVSQAITKNLDILSENQRSMGRKRGESYQVSRWILASYANHHLNQSQNLMINHHLRIGKPRESEIGSAHVQFLNISVHVERQEVRVKSDRLQTPRGILRQGHSSEITCFFV